MSFVQGHKKWIHPSRIIQIGELWRRKRVIIETSVSSGCIFQNCRNGEWKLRKKTCKNFISLENLGKLTIWHPWHSIKMLDFLQKENILRLQEGAKRQINSWDFWKGDTVMLVAFGTFGAIYLAGMIAMTVRGLKAWSLAINNTKRRVQGTRRCFHFFSIGISPRLTQLPMVLMLSMFTSL